MRARTKRISLQSKQSRRSRNLMINAGCEIRAYRTDSYHNLIRRTESYDNLIAVCCARPRGPYTAEQAWEITGGGKGLGFEDFQSFKSFTQKQVKPSENESETGKNSKPCIVDRSVWLHAFKGVRECREIVWNDSVTISV